MIRIDGTSIKEEIVNAVTHGIGVILAITGCVFLLFTVMKDHNPVKTLGVSIFGITLILMYLSSTLFHSLMFTRAKHILKIIDYSSISLLIAGSFTPVIIATLSDINRIIMIIISWAIALAGIILHIFTTFSTKRSLILFLASGWMAVVIIKPVYQAIHMPGIILLLAGGLFYSIGTIFFAWKKLSFHHGIWHLFVLAGSACHFFLMFHI